MKTTLGHLEVLTGRARGYICTVKHVGHEQTEKKKMRISLVTKENRREIDLDKTDPVPDFSECYRNEINNSSS